MVFELTDTLIHESVLKNKTLRDSFHNLFLGFEEGNLLLSLSPNLLDFLEKGLDDTLSKRVINYLQHRAFVHYDVLWQTKVVLENPDLTNHELAIDFFKNTSAIQPPTLLCENLNDAKFYFKLCEEYFGIEYINTKNGQGAGGSSVADNLEDIVNNKGIICLSIVDSDIKYPGSDDGGTYAAIVNKCLSPHSSYDVYKLGVHEIENLIPIEIICKHIKNKHARKLAKRLKVIDNNGDVLKYYDIKEGVKISSIREQSKYYDFANDIYDRLKKPSERNSFEDYLTVLTRNKNNIVFLPLCPSILDTFISLDSRYYDRFVYCDYLREEWNNIKAIMVTFFCARQSEPIN